MAAQGLQVPDSLNCLARTARCVITTPKGDPMHGLTSYLTVGTLVFGMLLPGTAAAQAPLPNTAPRIDLKWLASLKLSPASHYVSPSTGGQVTGTLTLLRPAVKDTTVALSMPGATVAEGPFQLADGAAIPYSVSIPARKSQGTFTIITSKGTWSGSRQFTVNATLGSERVSASFKLLTRD
jgi:hypothetical protein